MKIAFATPYLPNPPDTGGKIRTFHLLKALSRDHAVDLFTVYYGTAPEPGDDLRKICRGIHLVPLHKEATRLFHLARRFVDPLPRLADHFFAPDAALKIRQSLKEGNYDLLVADEIFMTPYVEGINGHKLLLRQKIDHLHYREVNSAQPPGMRRLTGWMEVQKLRRYECRVTDRYNGVICCSQEDANLVHVLNPRIPAAVVGNGVDLSSFTPQNESPGPPTLLYTGTMNYFPNIDAVQYFFREIHPHLVRIMPDVRILIVGHNPPPEIMAWQSLPNVKITGSVADIRPYLTECTATMVPLRMGGGTRLKIMESVAAGRAVVSTSVGAEGLGMRHEEHLLLADDPLKFAEEAAKLLCDRDLRHRLVAAAQPYVASHFSWEVLGGKFEAVCRSVAEKGTL